MLAFLKLLFIFYIEIQYLTFVNELSIEMLTLFWWARQGLFFPFFIYLFSKFIDFFFFLLTFLFSFRYIFFLIICLCVLNMNLFHTVTDCSRSY